MAPPSTDSLGSPDGRSERPFGPDAPFPQEPAYDFGGNAGNGEETLTLHDLLDVALRGRWIILASLLLVASAVAVYTYRLPDLYEAYSLLFVKTDPGTELAEVLPSSAIVGSGQRRAVGNEMLILRQSHAIAERTAGRLFELGQTPEGEPLTVLKPEEESDAPPTTRTVADRIQRLYLTVGLEDENLDLLRITATSMVPGEAALIANLYAEAYLERTRETSRASVTASRVFLEEQVDSVATELTGREEAVRSFMSREGAIQLDDEANHLVGQLSALQAQHDEARISGQMKAATIVGLERELGRIEPRLAARLAAGTEDEMAAVQEQIQSLQGQLEQIYLRNPGLRDSSSPPPDVANFQRQIGDLHRRAAELSERLLRDALATGGIDVSADGIARVTELRRRLVDERIELSGHQTRADIIGSRIGGYESELSRIPAQSIELARLSRDRQSTERLVLALSARLQEARLAEQSEIGYAEIIRPAFAPSIPFTPNRPRHLGLGILLGLAVGFALAFMRVHLDHRIHRPDDLRDLGYAVLGVIPDVTELVREELTGAEAVEADGHTFAATLTALLLPLSQASEAYRALRTSVQFSRLDALVQTIVVTSPDPGAGKSTTAANLAIVMTQAGRRVLLVDADLRQPKLHSLFGAKRRPGLVDALFMKPEDTLPKGPPSEELLAEGIIPSGVDDVDLLPAGTAVPYSSEVLGSRALRDRIEGWRQLYDIIIFDTPPTLAATDAVLLSTQADATLVVVRAGHTKDFELHRTLQLLRSVGTRAVGVVLNGFDTSLAYGYKYRYTHGYGQKYGYGYSKVLQEKLRKHTASRAGAVTTTGSNSPEGRSP